MTLSIWRYAHLALAFLSTAFLLVLSVTGVILAYDAIDEKLANHKVDHFETITLAQVLPTLRENYFEVIEVKVDHNQFVALDALDEDGKSIQAYIDPTTGKTIGEIKPKSGFIQWVTALHRSLFLKEIGRTIVAVVSFLLVLISVSGFILIIKRQKGLKHFFTKINKDFFSQYFHVISGRLLLIPILLIAITGSLIFMLRLDYFKGENHEIKHQTSTDKAIALKDITFFKTTQLADVTRVEFPFIPDDEDEPFIIHLKDRSVSVNQVTGQIVSEDVYPYAQVLEQINVDVHTGRTSYVWALVLGVASFNILLFIYSGFVIMWRRTRTKIKNKFNASEAEIVILVGSENGTTLHFANQIHQQFLGQNKKSYLAQMNNYQVYPKASNLLIFTSTHGLGDAPSNAVAFEKRLDEFPQKQDVNYSVVGFGSKSYTDYCAFAERVQQQLQRQNWAKESLELMTVNDRSIDEFVAWAQAWSDKSLIALATSPALYEFSIPGMLKLEVVEKTTISEDNSTFKICLKPKKNSRFQSGDLLAIYPGGDHRERFYSIGKNAHNLQLMVKLFHNGLGSEFLYDLEVGSTIDGRILANPQFHVPQEAQQIIMIANGTGIAPFLGMINENVSKKKMRLYAGFRFNNSLTKDYQLLADRAILEGRLESIHFAFSREEYKHYVMDLIRNDAAHIADVLKQGGVIMICGALKMQRDVEAVLEEIVKEHCKQSLSNYHHQILTDCY